MEGIKPCTASQDVAVGAEGLGCSGKPLTEVICSSVSSEQQASGAASLLRNRRGVGGSCWKKGRWQKIMVYWERWNPLPPLQKGSSMGKNWGTQRRSILGIGATNDELDLHWSSHVQLHWIVQGRGICHSAALLPCWAASSSNRSHFCRGRSQESCCHRRLEHYSRTETSPHLIPVPAGL